MNSTLLKLLEKDFKKKFSNTISSKYWHRRTNRILDEIKKKGMDNFRGFNSGIGIGYVDHRNVDIRNILGKKEKIVSKAFDLSIFNSVYSKQVKLTKKYCDSYLNFKRIFYENSPICLNLLNNYKFENTCSWGAVDKINLNGKNISTLYLEMANRIDFINNFINLKNIRSFCEIGSGFGANAHFILSNFKNIKKIICIDIFPTIFVLTEYLRSIFGKNVIDYCQTKNLSEIKFQNNEELEIFCIPNWEADKIRDNIDHLHNAHSFVEMSVDQIKLYKEKVFKFCKSSSFILYNRDIEERTLDEEKISELFEVNFKKYQLSLIEYFRKKDTVFIYDNSN